MCVYVCSGQDYGWSIASKYSVCVCVCVCVCFG